MDNAKLDELLPCPFCGGDAHIGTVRYSQPLDDIRWGSDDAPITEAFYGHCARCAAGHKSSFAGGYRTEAEAVAKWNTRAELPAIRAMQGEVERLRTELVSNRYKLPVVTDEMARSFIAKHREIWPGAGWPDLETSKKLIAAALNPGDAS